MAPLGQHVGVGRVQLVGARGDLDRFGGRRGGGSIGSRGGSLFGGGRGGSVSSRGSGVGRLGAGGDGQGQGQRQQQFTGGAHLRNSPDRRVGTRCSKSLPRDGRPETDTATYAMRAASSNDRRGRRGNRPAESP
ncbi:hypothetical protein LI87_0117900 [Stenotrophomonas maltophilia]|nr:hypothetical protein LI87_0117900 [Stenotrophomonas maltophilia]